MILTVAVDRVMKAMVTPALTSMNAKLETVVVHHEHNVSISSEMSRFVAVYRVMKETAMSVRILMNV
jgi:secreted Zn-dependent insulinase-like peptidase